MSSSKLLAGAALAGALLVGACGFQPMYGSAGVAGGTVAERLEAVEIGTIPDRTGQKLRNALIDRMHRSGEAAPQYRLDVSVTTAEQKLSISKDSSTERAQLVYVAKFRLVDKASGKQLLASSTKTDIVYDFLQEQYGLLVSRDNAFDRAIGEVSEEITNRVAAALGRKP